MTVDLRDQLRELCAVMEEEQGPLSAADVRARSASVVALELPMRRPPSPKRRALVAAAGFAVILALVGGLALLIRVGSGATPADDVTATTASPTPTTALSTPVIPSDLEPIGRGQCVVEARDGAFILPPPGANDIDLPVVSRSVTASPIGDIYWTVFEASSAETLEEMMDSTWADGPELDASGVEPFISGSGIQIRAWRELHETIGETSLDVWHLWFDWGETVALIADDELRETLDGAFTLVADSFERGVIEVGLYSAGRHGEPLGRVSVAALLELSIARDGSVWVVDVVDSETSALVGSITGSIPLAADDDILDLLTGRNDRQLIHVVSTGASVDVLRPDWFEPLGQGRPEDLIGFDNAFFAYMRDERGSVAAETHIWRSTDGRAWESFGPGDFPAAASMSDPIAEREGVLIAEYWDGDQVYVTRRSEDGISWRSPLVPPDATAETWFDSFGNHHGNPNGRVYPIASGWVWISGHETDHAIWVSVDGDTWRQIEPSKLPAPTGPPENRESASGWAADDRIVYWFSNTLVIGEVQ
jgi:hypothetical protein